MNKSLNDLFDEFMNLGDTMFGELKTREDLEKEIQKCNEMLPLLEKIKLKLKDTDNGRD